MIDETREVVITGMGCWTPLGTDVESTWQAILKGESAARSWSDLQSEGFPISLACRATHPPGEGLRGHRLALVAAQEALAQARLFPTGLALFLGTTLGESELFERPSTPPDAQEVTPGMASPLDLPPLSEGTADALASRLAKTLGIGGPAVGLAAACAAGNYAIGLAADQIRSGRITAALAGGVEPFSRVAHVGFNRSRAMTKDTCRPFDRSRAGMMLGEGAGCVVLESLASARARGVEPLAIIRSLGLSCDAEHPTRPAQDGQGMAASLREALMLGGVRSDEVGWICAHGSGTVTSDLAEARAILAVFGDKTPVSGLKGALGHAMGAATAIEAVMAVQTLRTSMLPPTVGTLEPDPSCAIDVVMAPRLAPELRWAINFGAAFGGLNAALLMGKVC